MPDQPSDFSALRASVAEYYTRRLQAHGATPQGVDWNSEAAQTRRFEQLLKIGGPGEAFSLNDYGCGYGALLGYLRARGWTGAYQGYDVSPEMIARATQLHAGDTRCAFTTEPSDLTAQDYCIASGIFNVRLNLPDPLWREYVLATLSELDALSQRGFSFNALTSYSDPERMRPDLHYADPASLFDHCMRRYSRQVALLHDYGLFEFTVLVRKPGESG